MATTQQEAKLRQCIEEFSHGSLAPVYGFRRNALKEKIAKYFKSTIEFCKAALVVQVGAGFLVIADKRLAAGRVYSSYVSNQRPRRY